MCSLGGRASTRRANRGFFYFCLKERPPSDCIMCKQDGRTGSAVNFARSASASSSARPTPARSGSAFGPQLARPECNLQQPAARLCRVCMALPGPAEYGESTLSRPHSNRIKRPTGQLPHSEPRARNRRRTRTRHSESGLGQCKVHLRETPR